MVWLTLSTALAHGSRFGVSALSVAPEDPASWWGLASGWGVVHTEDEGERWTWICDEALGTSAVYDVEAVSADAALVASEAGLLLVGVDCSLRVVGGLEGGYPAFVVAASGGGWWVSAYTDAWDGLWRCDTEACVRGPVGGDGTYVKSAVVDGTTTWVTTVAAGDLAAALWRVEGDAAAVVAAWPDGSVDPRILHAAGDTLLVWAQGRDLDHPPTLLRSTDGGASFEPSLAVGVYTDPVPALLDAGIGTTFYLGTDSGRTFFSSDGGAGFTEVSETAPVVRCSAVVGAGRIYCADHYADGYDVGRWQFGRAFGGAGCLDDATPAACVATCDAVLPTFQEAGLYGGEACYPTVVAVAPGGCGGDGEAWLIVVLPVAGLGARRRRPSQSPS